MKRHPTFHRDGGEEITTLFTVSIYDMKNNGSDILLMGGIMLV